MGTRIIKTTARAKRGETSRRYDCQFGILSSKELLILFSGVDAQKRTSAARFLGERKCVEAIPFLCERLKETALYTRIAITEALGAIGEPAIPELIGLLGKVGTNQHRELPEKGFYKKGYPLPRDIVARTIVKMGCPALKPLEKVVLEANRTSVLEAIDAIGHIAYYENDESSEPVLMKAYEEYCSERLVRWKLVRAFQALPTERIRRLLTAVISTSVYPEQRWEAVRSLGQLGGEVPLEVVIRAQRDAHKEVRNMARLFLRQEAIQQSRAQRVIPPDR